MWLGGGRVGPSEVYLGRHPVEDAVKPGAIATRQRRVDDLEGGVRLAAAVQQRAQPGLRQRTISAQEDGLLQILSGVHAAEREAHGPPGQPRPAFDQRLPLGAGQLDHRIQQREVRREDAEAQARIPRAPTHHREAGHRAGQEPGQEPVERHEALLQGRGHRRLLPCPVVQHPHRARRNVKRSAHLLDVKVQGVAEQQHRHLPRRQATEAREHAGQTLSGRERPRVDGGLGVPVEVHEPAPMPQKVDGEVPRDRREPGRHRGADIGGRVRQGAQEGLLHDILRVRGADDPGRNGGEHPLVGTKVHPPRLSRPRRGPRRRRDLGRRWRRGNKRRLNELHDHQTCAPATRTTTALVGTPAAALPRRGAGAPHPPHAPLARAGSQPYGPNTRLAAATRSGPGSAASAIASNARMSGSSHAKISARCRGLADW